jgi:hypothetical protein
VCAAQPGDTVQNLERYHVSSQRRITNNSLRLHKPYLRVIYADDPMPAVSNEAMLSPI